MRQEKYAGTMYGACVAAVVAGHTVSDAGTRALVTAHPSGPPTPPEKGHAT